jgi:sec-independent protein translocase protein TatB
MTVPGFQEWLVIALVALLVFGPNRLPEIARTTAKALARFRAEARRNIDELKRSAELEGLDTELRDIRREVRGTQQELRRGLRGMLEEPQPVRRAALPTDAPPPVDLEAT